MAGLAAVDLNLLVPLRSILEHRNLSQAGREIGKSQPAMSAVLRKSRTLFGDDLLVRQANRYVRTPRGDEVLAELDDVLARLARALSPPTFDPTTCERRFAVAASDYVVEILAAPLVRHVATSAPGVTVHFLALQPDNDATGVDLTVLPSHDAGRRHAPLFQDDWVAVAAPGRLGPGPLCVTDLLRHRFVRYLVGGIPSAADRALDDLAPGIEVPVGVPDFSSALRVALATDLVTVVPSRLAAERSRTVSFSQASFKPPLPRLDEVITWPKRSDHDPANVWLRSAVIAAAGTPTG